MRLLALYREAFAGLPRPVWLLSAVVLVNRAGTMVLPFLVLYLTAERGLAADEAASVLFLYGLGALAGAAAGGWISDRAGPLAVQAASLGGAAAIFLLLGGVEGKAAIAATTFALAVVNEAFRPANSTAITQESPSGLRARAFALRQLATNAGMTVGTAGGGFLAGWDYAWLFRVDAATSLAAAGLLVRAFAGRRKRGASAAARAEAGSAALSPGAEAGSAPTTPGGLLPAEEAAALAAARALPWSDRPFLAFLGLQTAFCLLFFQWLGSYPLTLRDLFGLSEARIGLAFALNTTLIVCFQQVLVHGVGRRDPLAVCGFSALAAGVGFGMLPFGRGYAWVLLGVVVWTIGDMLGFPVAEAWVAERADPRARGRYLGGFGLAFPVAFAAGPPGGTWLYARVGAQPFWAGCALYGALLAGGFLLLGRRLRGRFP